MEKTQAYNLSLGPSKHDQLVAVTSTRRASVTHRVTDQGRGLINCLANLRIGERESLSAGDLDCEKRRLSYGFIIVCVVVV